MWRRAVCCVAVFAVLMRLRRGRRGAVAVRHAPAALRVVAGLARFAEYAKQQVYRPPWWLVGAIPQTVWAEVPPPRAGDAGVLSRLLPWHRGAPRAAGFDEEVLPMPAAAFPAGSPMQCCPNAVPEGVVRLNWYQTPGDGPAVVVCPGLTSSSESGYVRQLCAHLAARGYRPVVYQPRGVGGDVATPFLYSAGYTHDVRRALAHVRAQLPAGVKVYGLGTSLGGNYLTKYAGEEGGACLLDALCNLAGPVDCAASMRHFDESAYGKHLFNPLLAGSLQKVRRRAEGAFARASAAERRGVDMDAARRARTVRAFDAAATAKMMGCRDVDHYYDSASCMHVLHALRRPTLFLHAENDPIVPARLLPHDRIAESSYVISLVSPEGAHSMTWPTGPGAAPWAVAVVDEFFRTVGGHA
eukprot:TRINITY_DN6372_c0_g1_i5.p1 TRINITY_DN6372_c0_g1~~TRINITY_DN6372_c0_g1_i5.p1  ORF type:complete len:413 (+),score=112.51 TRINITY_DN6372_c0_g1_i5:120-1358(+)